MQTKEYRTFDKSDWGNGVWQDEPDKMQWQDEETGLPCLVKRSQSGHLCGYVGVAEGHPLFKLDYGEVRDCGVHGGLTFADVSHNANDESTGICHVPDPGEPETVWWFGFDCAHSGDSSPGMDAYMESEGIGSWHGYSTYKNVSFVKSECKSLALTLSRAIA